MKRITSTLKFLIIFFFTLSTQHIMAQKSATDMVKAAKQEIENLTPQQAQEEISKGNVTVIDIREPGELQKTGKIAGAVNAPRGMLEFYADPSLPSHKPEFDKEKRIILYCASSGRSALAVKTLKEMGYTNIAHIDGGMNAWKAAGLPVEEP
jgi:rhodanese-related sulfurtransferase